MYWGRLYGGHTRIWILSFQKRKFEPQRTRRTQRREIKPEMRRPSETVKFSDSSALRFPVSFVFSVSSASSVVNFFSSESASWCTGDIDMSTGTNGDMWRPRAAESYSLSRSGLASFRRYLLCAPTSTLECFGPKVRLFCFLSSARSCGCRLMKRPAS